MVLEIKAYHYKDAKYESIDDDPIARALREEFGGTPLSGVSECFSDRRYHHQRYEGDRFRLDSDLAEHLKYDTTVIRRLVLIPI